MSTLQAVAALTLSALALQEIIRLRRSSERYRIESRTDALTGCWNKRRWLECTRSLVRDQSGFSFVLFDLANLKAANDLLGHSGADHLLAEIASSIRKESDGVYRIGGDEFAIIIPGGRLCDADAVCRRIEKKIGVQFLAPFVPVFVAGSGGEWSQGVELEEQLLLADQRLEAKKKNRKRSVGAPVTREETLALLQAS